MVTYSSTGPRKQFREMIAAHGGGHGRGLPRSILSRTLPSHWASAVARVSDRGRVAEVQPIHRNCGALNQGFPFSPLQCRQGRTRMGGWVSSTKCARCMQWLCCVLFLMGSHLVRCSSVYVPELSDSDSHSGSPHPFITRPSEDL